MFITAVAALVALSAASRPASRILRRAVGLAASAAAAAVKPAASISRLTATFAIRSIVVSLLVDFPLEPVVPLAMRASRECRLLDGSPPKRFRQAQALSAGGLDHK
ncbi:MAG: hypothetical protein M3N06_05170 [Pseudomonadota bacterium]|nr:hypothetical protein [Pseudomonadota bacterium]